MHVQLGVMLVCKDRNTLHLSVDEFGIMLELVGTLRSRGTDADR